MRQTLARWVGDADALRQVRQFGLPSLPPGVAHLPPRLADYYIALMGELFLRVRPTHEYDNADDWARLGNALTFFNSQELDAPALGIDGTEAALLAGAAFYLGGFPASAYLCLRDIHADTGSQEFAYCRDLIVRPSDLRSSAAPLLLEALRTGNEAGVAAQRANADVAEQQALLEGPDRYIPARLLARLLHHFELTNIRRVLPDGWSGFWDDFVASAVSRTPPMWEFFPSQVDAIDRGLLVSNETFSLQMPTGAGKTSLCETLVYHHLRTRPDDAAILIVPFRSLASELRKSLVRRLNSMNLASRCAYGGTVPSGDEVRALTSARFLVATPEALSGLLSADPDFYRRVSLVICDEGHLLDSGSRGVGFELLLARLRAREGGAPRVVFLSAIIPNIEEINAWLGGSDDTVVRSDYRPASTEFASLRVNGSGANATVDLVVQPHEPAPPQYAVTGFLRREDFRWWNASTNRWNTYGFGSVKTLAVGAARKALALGTVALFATNKRGAQGAIGLAEELFRQLQAGLPLAQPLAYTQSTLLAPVVEYLTLEYGAGWTGTRALAAGAVLHHGDVPQETREVVELLLRSGGVRLVICTSTLAEGVNLPIRTLVLYSVVRVMPGGREDMLARDIKNLVGRAGRAGATTKGLVVCANPDQWRLVERVALDQRGEPVVGFLRVLFERLQGTLARQPGVTLNNPALEATPDLHTLVDGIDAMLVDLAADEIGEERLNEIARSIAEDTFAAQSARAASLDLMRQVFELRAAQIHHLKTAGRLHWIRETGARPRSIGPVENDLVGRRSDWSEIADPFGGGVLHTLLEWAWSQPELRSALAAAYGTDDDGQTSVAFADFERAVQLWVDGTRFVEIASQLGRTVDDVLHVQATPIGFVLQTLVEQAVGLLGKVLEERGEELSPSVTRLPEHLRYGVPSSAGVTLAAHGLRHRAAAVLLGASGIEDGLPSAVATEAAAVLGAREPEMAVALGELVLANTRSDLAAMTRA